METYQTLYYFPIGGISLEDPKNFSKNPYSYKVIDALLNYSSVVNLTTRKKGILDILSYLKADIFFFNWVEDLPWNRFGTLQALFFLIIILPLLKILKKKIVWTMHNKGSHKGKKYFNSLIQKKLLKNAKLIITHSSEGICYVSHTFGEKFTKNVKFIHHPIDNNLNKINIFFQKYDLLIWGAQFEYKGIYEFVKFVEQNKITKKILIAGTFPDPEYYNKVLSVKPANIIIENKFIKDDDLVNLFEISGYIVFTHTPNTVLSSGALMYSLSYGCQIIASSVGAFKDLADEGIIFNFKTFDDIFKIVNDGEKINRNFLSSFIETNSYNSFALRIINEVSSGH